MTGPRRQHEDRPRSSLLPRRPPTRPPPSSEPVPATSSTSPCFVSCDMTPPDLPAACGSGATADELLRRPDERRAVVRRPRQAAVRVLRHPGVHLELVLSEDDGRDEVVLRLGARDGELPGAAHAPGELGDHPPGELAVIAGDPYPRARAAHRGVRGDRDRPGRRPGRVLSGHPSQVRTRERTGTGGRLRRLRLEPARHPRRRERDRTRQRPTHRRSRHRAPPQEARRPPSRRDRLVLHGGVRIAAREPDASAAAGSQSFAIASSAIVTSAPSARHGVFAAVSSALPRGSLRATRHAASFSIRSWRARGGIPVKRLSTGTEYGFAGANTRFTTSFSNTGTAAAASPTAASAMQRYPKL